MLDRPLALGSDAGLARVDPAKHSRWCDSGCRNSTRIGRKSGRRFKQQCSLSSSRIRTRTLRERMEDAQDVLKFVVATNILLSVVEEKRPVSSTFATVRE